MKGNINHVEIVGIEAAVPCHEVDNTQYISKITSRRIKKQIELTGVKKRRVTVGKQKASDLATKAAEKLLQRLEWHKDDVDVLIFVTQSPDLERPSTAFLIQERLGLGKNCMVYDINFGCDGTIAGLITISSILQTVKGKGLLLVGESNALSGENLDRNALLEGDASAAIALSYTEETAVIKFAQFSDGGRADLLYKAFNKPAYMDGNAVLLFGISDVAESVREFLKEEVEKVEDIDYFVFHQAQKLIVDGIVQETGIPSDKVLFSCENFGNTSSASIPLTLCSSLGKDDEKEKVRVLLCGYGIGLSWGIVCTEIPKERIYPLLETDYAYGDRDKFE